MKRIIKTKLISGCFYVQIEEVGFNLLCASPQDVVKHLSKHGFIKNKKLNNISFETGPNAILLSDLTVQNYQFSNLCEFPVAQMLYRQGLGLPSHLNNSGKKPILIGDSKQIETQIEYITRGNYGLLNEFEFSNTNLDEDEISEIMDMKLKFAIGNRFNSEALLDIRYLINSDNLEIYSGIFLQRVAINKFVLTYKDEHIEIDLNLYENDYYASPYDLGYFKLQNSDFSIIHSGQGDGWEVNKTAMSSVLMFKGKIYLVDAPANIIEILNALGIGLNDIEGVFNTHCHDDHFVGLTSILLTDHKIKYFSSRVVRDSVMKKLSSLLSIPYEGLNNYFEYVDLPLDTWSNLDGLEVMPNLSVHPVETNIFYFRTLHNNEYLSYAHLADISSFDAMKKMIKKEAEPFGLSVKMYEESVKKYFNPATLKKIDIGGGMIHGDAKDFIEDQSHKIVLAHTENKKFTQTQKSIGSAVLFGMVDDLIPTQRDYIKEKAREYLDSFFPNLEKEKFDILLECDVKCVNSGTIILNERRKTDFVYLVLSGTIEKISITSKTSSYLYAGSFIGDRSIILDDIVHDTYRSLSYVNVLEIPKEKYVQFVEENNLYLDLDSLIIKSSILNQFWLFNGFLSPKVEHNIVNSIIYEEFEKEDDIVGYKDGLCLIIDGEVNRHLEGEIICSLKDKEFFGERHILEFKQNDFKYTAKTDVELYIIPKEVLKNIPIIHWKLFMKFQESRVSFH